VLLQVCFEWVTTTSLCAHNRPTPAVRIDGEALPVLCSQIGDTDVVSVRTEHVFRVSGGASGAAGAASIDLIDLIHATLEPEQLCTTTDGHDAIECSTCSVVRCARVWLSVLA
jgi:hypothetical protein